MLVACVLAAHGIGHDASKCVTCSIPGRANIIRMCDMTHLFIVIGVTRLIPPSYVWHDSVVQSPSLEEYSNPLDHPELVTLTDEIPDSTP